MLNPSTLIWNGKFLLSYALTFINALLSTRISLAAKLLAAESPLAVLKHRIDQKKETRPRFSTAFRFLWALLYRLRPARLNSHPRRTPPQIRARGGIVDPLARQRSFQISGSAPGRTADSSTVTQFVNLRNTGKSMDLRNSGGGRNFSNGQRIGNSAQADKKLKRHFAPPPHINRRQYNVFRH